MRLQLLSDLHLETEAFDPAPAPGAELLVLAGDIDSTWAGFERFRGWPVPVVFVAGNHEFDGREIGQARLDLRERCTRLGLRLLECESWVATGFDGTRVRFVGTTRWSDFDLYGAAGRERAMRAGKHFVKIMRATKRGEAFDAAAVREESLACRDWLQRELQKPKRGWEKTVAVTHFAPSLASADPRYGAQPGTASFCNADDDLLPFADLWLHGHLHCRHDYTVRHAGGATRVVCNPRGHGSKGEPAGHQPLLVLEV
jgi:DNA repair exonuclease SbcCD nuclease subunit